MEQLNDIIRELLKDRMPYMGSIVCFISPSNSSIEAPLYSDDSAMQVAFHMMRCSVSLLINTTYLLSYAQLSNEPQTQVSLGLKFLREVSIRAKTSPRS